MAITLKTRKALWGRSGNRCAFTGCGQALTDDGATAALVIGEEAHIVARELGGPRGAVPMTPEERDSLRNLILLCPTHHTIVDDDPTTYTVEKLLNMKEVHERSVMAAEPVERKRARLAEETYAGYIDEWIRRADLDHWNDWASSLVTDGQPSLAQRRFRALDDVRRWLLGRVWPGRHPGLEDSLHNFRFVLDDLISQFGSAVDDEEKEVLWTRRFYKIDRWDPKLYHQQLDAYRRHVALVENLAFELTRAANFVCDNVRETLDPRFRIEEGALLITTGMNMDLTYTVCRPEYREEERSTSTPYPGIKPFARVGPKRDIWMRASDF